MNIHHIGYLVKNIEVSREKFLALGFIEETEKEYDFSRNIYIQFIINGNHRIELVEPNPDDSKYFAVMKRFKNQPYHICYEVDKLDLTINKLSNKGFYLSQVPSAASCIGFRKVAFMQSPTIGIIELLSKEE